MDEKKLTEKQKRFIDYYIETGNASEACRLAGYKGKNVNNLGNENLAKLGIFIKCRLEQKQSERIASQNEVLEFLTCIMRKKEEATSERVKCAELLGKRWGTFIDRREDKADIDLNIKVDYGDNDSE